MNDYSNYHVGEQVTVHDSNGDLLTAGIITKLGTLHATVVDPDSGENYDLVYSMLRKQGTRKLANHEVLQEEEQEGKKFILSKNEKNIDGKITVSYEVSVDEKKVWESEEVVTNVYDYEQGWSAPDDFDENKLDLIQQTAEAGFAMIVESFDNVVELAKGEQQPPTGAAALPESAPKGKPAFAPDAKDLGGEDMGGGGGGGGGAGGGVAPEGAPAPEKEGEPGAEGEEKEEPGKPPNPAPFATPVEETRAAASLQRPSFARSILSSLEDKINNL